MRTAVLGTDPAETVAAETRSVLAYADASHFDDLRRFRAGVFADELGIQEPDYQDVFNDHFSKNVMLRREGVLRGAVRLVYGAESCSFYISYLALHPAYRNRARLALLLGAILHLMRENRLPVVYGHATAANLAMYLSIGCAVTGPTFRKYGFRCEWTPIVYRAGTNGSAEDRLVRRAREDLSDAEARWSFVPRVVVCPTPRVFDEVGRRLLSTQEIFGTIPHLGCALPELNLPPHVRCLHVVAPADVPAGAGGGFEEYNARLDCHRVIVVPRHSPCAALARVYGVVLGRHLVFADEWAAVSFAGLVGDVLVLADQAEAGGASAVAAAARRRGARARLVVTDSVEAMSALLFREYLGSLGPGPHDK